MGSYINQKDHTGPHSCCSVKQQPLIRQQLFTLKTPNEGWGYSLVVQHLPSMPKDLASIPNALTQTHSLFLSLSLKHKMVYNGIGSPSF